MRLRLFELVDVGDEAVGTIFEPVGSCGDHEFLVDFRRLELKRYPARPQRGRR